MERLMDRLAWFSSAGFVLFFPDIKIVFIFIFLKITLLYMTERSSNVKKF